MRLVLRNRLADQLAVLVIQRSLRAQQPRAVVAAPQVRRMTRCAICLVESLASREYVLRRQRPRKLSEPAATPAAAASPSAPAAPPTGSGRRRARSEITGQIGQHLR